MYIYCVSCAIVEASEAYRCVVSLRFNIPKTILAQMMRTSIYLVCAAVVVAVRSEDNHQLMNRYLEPVDVSVDPETVNYLLPKLAAKYRPNSDWKDVTDPRLYVLTEMESNDVDNQKEPRFTDVSSYIRSKKQSSRIGEAGGSLSIVNSLDVLRNRLLLEIARKKAKEGANRNRQLLMNLGKRAYMHNLPRIFFPTSK
uniref:Diuretic hormone 44-like protein n=1 Tax=Rhynchophorus ferrugineus TaxID=354439 RepID=A0A5Q0TXG0_RHYFE|nr:diuretic hormone 44-like protein [Rhynchophorus ferrugineus]